MTTTPATARDRRPAEAALAGLAGHGLAGRFRHWRGAGGERHMFSVFRLGPGGSDADVPRFEDAVVLAVARGRGDEPRILFADETGPLPDLFFASSGFRAAVAAGADEVHIHLLSEGRAARAALLSDLAG